MRSSPGRSAEDLKRRLAAEHADGREACTDGTAAFIAAALRHAAGPGAD
jgi:GrpB-like predicted nucleotidyltransferase (UPF0157 family)